MLSRFNSKRPKKQKPDAQSLRSAVLVPGIETIKLIDKNLTVQEFNEISQENSAEKLFQLPKGTQS